MQFHYSFVESEGFCYKNGIHDGLFRSCWYKIVCVLWLSDCSKHIHTKKSFQTSELTYKISGYMAKFDVRGIPHAFIINKHGKVHTFDIDCYTQSLWSVRRIQQKNVNLVDPMARTSNGSWFRNSTSTCCWWIEFSIFLFFNKWCKLTFFVLENLVLHSLCCWYVLISLLYCYVLLFWCVVVFFSLEVFWKTSVSYWSRNPTTHSRTTSINECPQTQRNFAVCRTSSSFLHFFWSFIGNNETLRKTIFLSDSRSYSAHNIDVTDVLEKSELIQRIEQMIQKKSL